MAYLDAGRYCSLRAYEELRANRVTDPDTFKVDGIYLGMLRLNSDTLEAASKQVRFHGHALKSPGMTIVRFAFVDEISTERATAIEPFEDGYINLKTPFIIHDRRDQQITFEVQQAYFLEYNFE